MLATVAGGIYFQEFATLAWWQFLAFFSGIAVMFDGLLLLIPPNPETTLEMKAPPPSRRLRLRLLHRHRHNPKPV